MKALEIDPDMQDEWRSVFMEAATNAILHGGGESVEICWSVRGKELWLEVLDTGGGPDEAYTTDPHLPEDPYQSEGRGLYIINHFCDRWEHWKSSEGYRLVMIKEHPGMVYAEEGSEILEATLEELSYSNESLNAFYELGDALVNSETLTKFIERSLQNLHQVVSYDRIFFSFSVNLEKELLENLKSDQSYTIIEIEQSPLLMGVLDKGEEYVWEGCEEISEEEDFNTYGCGICCPIFAAGGDVGIFVLVRASEDPHFKASELSMIKMFTDLFGIAIAHANNALVREKANMAMRELDIAAKLQRDLIPLPQVSDTDVWALFTARKSAREIGGDYVDMCFNEKGEMVLVAVDVMGKGVPAAFLAGMIRMALHINVHFSYTLKDLIDALNKSICEGVGDTVIFATCALAVIDKHCETIEFVNAGHCAPLLMRDGELVHEIKASGPPLGLYDNAEYRVESYSLQKADRVLMVTDGLFEWEKNDGIWGWDNWKKFLTSHPFSEPKILWNDLQEEILKSSKKKEARDDQAMLCWELRK